MAVSEAFTPFSRALFDNWHRRNVKDRDKDVAWVPGADNKLHFKKTESNWRSDFGAAGRRIKIGTVQIFKWSEKTLLCLVAIVGLVNCVRHPRPRRLRALIGDVAIDLDSNPPLRYG